MDFDELMRQWYEKMGKLKTDLQEKEVFILAEKILAKNSDIFSTLAEELSVVTVESKNLKSLREQWELVKDKKIFIGSSGETLWEMAKRLKDQGNG